MKSMKANGADCIMLKYLMVALFLVTHSELIYQQTLIVVRFWLQDIKDK